MLRTATTESTHTARWSALWGGRGGDDPRKRAGVVLALLALLVAVAPASALAKDGDKGAFVPTRLRQQALVNPEKVFNVVVRGVPGEKSASIATYFTSGHTGKVKRQFYSVNGVAGSLSGADLLKLAENNHVLSIVADSTLESTDYVSQERWRETTGVSSLWGTDLSPAPQAPAIAIVDSGVDATKAGDFGARVVASVNFSSLSPVGATGDDQGHGTMVAGLAAGAGSYSGVARNAPIVDLRTSDAHGASRTSDVIAACDWILQHKDQYNIRVANFSMRGSHMTSFRYDPLDAAVERLWFSGVVVVAAAGNNGTGVAQKMAYSPGNDPFVISVGALSTEGTVDPRDDTVASWSAYGHTLDGFVKPELSAPGRWMIAPVPMASTLATTVPERVVAPGYMWMSGTSLAAPIVAGAAAQILARHPEWTPDQVKGALMKTASALPLARFAGGVGEVNAAKAAKLGSAPNPHKNLNAFIKSDGGTPYFDGAAWAATVKASTDWSETDWSETDWSETDWSETDWSETDWSETDWSETDWSETDWSETDWSESIWSP